MKFKFSLEKVMQHRKLLENLAQRDFQEAIVVLNEQEDILIKMRESIVKAREEAFGYQSRGEKISGSMTQIDEFIVGQDLRVERQKKIIEVQQKIVEEKREILRLKAIDYKIVEELKDKKKEQFKKEQAKLEQKKLDDNVVMRFNREKINE